MTCGDDGTLWCPEQEGCISSCEADCGCKMGTNDYGTTTSTTTTVITEQSKTNNEDKTTPERFVAENETASLHQEPDCEMLCEVTLYINV